MLTYRYRIYPTKHQTTILTHILEGCCFIYNRVAEEYCETWARHHIQELPFSMMRLVQQQRSEWLQQQPSLKFVQAQTAQHVCLRVNTRFRQLLDAGKNPCLPKIDPSNYHSFCYPQYKLKFVQDWLWPEKGDLLWVPGVGGVVIKLHRPVGGVVSKLTLVRRCNKWFACLYARVATPLYPLPTKKQEVSVGLDVTNSIILSSGERYVVPRRSKNFEKVTRQLQDNPTPRLVTIYAKLEARWHNQYDDFVHKLSHHLATSFDLVIFDAAIYTIPNLVRYTAYKAKQLRHHVVIE